MSWQTAVPITPTEDEVPIGAMRPDKKIIAERQALALVASLADVPALNEEQVRNLVRFIEPRHYNDLEEERFASGMCPYPLCQNSRPSNNNLGKYRINLREKKVYDITKRKLFCSNFCFTASCHLSKQIPVDACWDRSAEFQVTSLNFLHRETSGTTKTEPSKDDRLAVELDVHFEQMTLKSETETELDSDDDPYPTLRNQYKESDSSSTSSTDSLDYWSKQPAKSSAPKNIVVLPLSSLANNNSAAKEVQAPFKKAKLALNDWVKVCEVMKQWKTQETLNLFIYRDSRVEEKKSNEKLPEVSETVVPEFPHLPLDRPERKVADEQREYELKVMAFFAGDRARHVRFDENVTEVQVETKEKKTKKVEASVEPQTDPTDAEIILPPVDSVDQDQIREHLAVERLSSSCLRAFNALVRYREQYTNQQSVGVVDFVVFVNNMSDVHAMFRRLVSTFHLTAENVALLPTEWTLASLLLFAASCHCGLIDSSSSPVLFDHDMEAFFFDCCCKFLFTWFPSSTDVLVFMDKFTKILS